MRDVECPYCEAEQDICHDDGYGYDEGVFHEQECRYCEKTFTFQTMVSYVYEVSRADCLNGGDHELQPVMHVPFQYPDWVKCANCEFERRGEWSPPQLRN